MVLCSLYWTGICPKCNPPDQVMWLGDGQENNNHGSLEQLHARHEEFLSPVSAEKRSVLETNLLCTNLPWDCMSVVSLVLGYNLRRLSPSSWCLDLHSLDTPYALRDKKLRVPGYIRRRFRQTSDRKWQGILPWFGSTRSVRKEM